jgi:ligand-binding sensor domain-containing protein/serine phosphatase RsbU (regulator of sigma subunit)
MRLNRCYIIVIIVLIYSPLCAQDYLEPEIFSIENGLSSRHVNTLSIDHYGYLWAGTSYGLNRFDGYRFRKFFTSADNNEPLGYQRIRSVKVDAAGNLWILNQAGINRYDYKTGIITKIPVSSFDEPFSKESVLIDLCAATNGKVWILTNKTLTVLSSDFSEKTYPFPGNLLQEGTIPTCLIADANGNLWIGTTGGLLLFYPEQGVFRELVNQNSQGLLSNSYVNCLYIDRDNAIWIGTRNGLNRVDPVDFAFRSFYPEGTRTLSSLNEIHSITSAENGVLILATSSGIFRFKTGAQLFTQIYQASINQIRSVAVDSTGIIWGGSTAGILKIRKSSLTVQNYPIERFGVSRENNHILSAIQGPGGKFFLGFNDDGFGIVDESTMKISRFKTIDGSNVVNFCPFKPDLYFIVSQHGIEVFDVKDNRRKSLKDLYPFINEELFKQVQLNCIFYDGISQLWLGTSNGIQHIKLDSSYHVSKAVLEYNSQQVQIGKVYSIIQDPFRNIWLGTDNSLLYYNPVKGNVSKYTPYDVNLMNTEHKAVYAIVPEKSDVFWLGTSGGIFRFDAATREFTALNVPGIVNSVFSILAVDTYGNLWFSNETGLYHYIKASNAVKNYDQKEGLLNYTYTAISSGPEGRIFITGPAGLSIVKTGRQDPVHNVQKVVITGIRLLDNDPMKEDLYYQVPDTIYLPWGRKPLQIDFAVLDYSRPEWNHFRYSLGKSGRDAVWINLGRQNQVIIDQLPPGRHLFRVTGSNRDKVWNTAGTSLVIIVEAPYWRSKIGLVLILLAGSFFVFLFVRFWIRQFFNLSRENREREMFARQIMLQKEELTLKNKSITDSINYAKRIQTAMLPPLKLFKSIFSSSFILFMPKDIVSGDFYWVNKLGDKIFIAAVDCTGHGVPGAFMSIIGFELFRKITNIEGLSRPSDILNRLNEDFHEIFRDIDNVVLRDGMDVAFCSIDKKDMIVEFSGAFNPLYIIRDNKITEVKGDRFAIGLDETNFKDQTFKNHIIPIQKGDIIYLFSDGFADQFGGPDGKKYKYRRFRHLLLNLHQLPMEKQHEILENNVVEWRGAQEQVDDILVIGIKVDF